MLESTDMRRLLKPTFIAILGYLLLVQSGLLSAVALFWLTGLIPGTDYSLPPLGSTILLVAVGVSSIVLTRPNLLKLASSYRPRAQKTSQRLPRRRYARINVVS